MKTYIHNYTLPSKAEDLLYRATRLMANDCYSAAVERINEARQILQEYLAKDNMEAVIDKESYGYIKEQDTFDHDQLCFIRDEFACIMERTKNANDELDIINKCCRLLDDPEHESYEEWLREAHAHGPRKRLRTTMRTCHKAHEQTHQGDLPEYLRHAHQRDAGAYSARHGRTINKK